MPFAAYCTDPCDGRTQGTPGMYDSLPYRNDAAIVFRRQIRSLPTRSGVIGVATCDKGPAGHDDGAGRHAAICPCVLVPGGVTLLAEEGEDAGRVQSVGARFAHGEITLEEAAENLLPRLRLARRRLPVSGHRGNVAGGRRGAGHVADACRAGAFGTADLARYGAPLGPRACWRSKRAASPMRDILTDARSRNAMMVHAAFGGSTNLILHIPAIAHAAGLPRPTAEDWTAHQPPDSAPGRCAAQRPEGLPTVQVFMAGGVPEVMLHLRRAGLLETGVLTASGETLGRDARLVGAVGTPRRAAAKCCGSATASIPTTSSWTRDRRARRGLTSTVTLPARQSRAGRFGHQEHRHRPERGRTPTASIASAGRRASSSPNTPPSRPSRAGPDASSRAT